MMERLKKLKFSAIIFSLVVAIICLLILQSLFSTPRQTRPGNELTVPGVNQAASYQTYKTIDSDSSVPASPSNRVIVKIYVENISELTTPMFTALKQQALLKEGLTEDQVYFVLVEYNDLEQEEDYLKPQTDKTSVDPTDPSSFYNDSATEQKVRYQAEPITGMTFVEYVEITKPATSNYEIYKDGPQKYTVVLKGGYTKQQFEEGFLSNFPDKNAIQLTYVNRDELRN